MFDTLQNQKPHKMEPITQPGRRTFVSFREDAYHVEAAMPLNIDQLRELANQTASIYVVDVESAGWSIEANQVWGPIHEGRVGITGFNQQAFIRFGLIDDLHSGLMLLRDMKIHCDNFWSFNLDGICELRLQMGQGFQPYPDCECTDTDAFIFEGYVLDLGRSGHLYNPGPIDYYARSPITFQST